MYPYIDFHTHSRSHQSDVIDILSWYPYQEKNFDFYTIGYHPWWTKDILSENELQLLKDHYTTNKKCLAIGECGLDKLKGIDIQSQENIFVQQVAVANQLSAPLIVHCVRQYDALLRLRKSEGKTPWVIHGFFRNKTLAKQLLDAGFYLSVAPRIKMHDSFIETLKYVPHDRIFLETDSDHSLSIGERYTIFSKLTQQSMDSLSEQIAVNIKQIIGEEKIPTFNVCIEEIKKA
ncbi:MAG: TatD family hydrolase [Saprospiraceae bacterium]